MLPFTPAGRSVRRNASSCEALRFQKGGGAGGGVGTQVLEGGVELVVERGAEGQRTQLAQLAACVQLRGEAAHAVRPQLDEEPTTRLAPPRL